MSHDEPFCPRTIKFLIPGNPPVEVTAVEDDGRIKFTVDVLNTTAIMADLRGLFFHFTEAKLPGLQITGGGGWITGSQIKQNGVIDMLDGVNMSGAAKPFDIGLKFGTPGHKKDNINFPVEFTLSNAAGNLTLDDIAHQEFGARLTSIGGPGGSRAGGVSKITTIAPAAPDAKDDVVSMFEDGGSGLDDPLSIPIPNLFNVLANDTDLDGDALTVFAFHNGPSHGTVTVAPDGNILYTPHKDYSGTDSFEYCVSDGNGGQDSATVNLFIEAVADKPDVVWQCRTGADVYEIILTVTATQTDLDSSEFIDRIELSGLPPGVTVDLLSVNPSSEDDQIIQDFVIRLPHNTDTVFNLGVTAYSKETSNGDEQAQTVTIPIEMQYNRNEATKTFLAEDKSIWGEGGAFVFHEEQFIGPDIPINFDETFITPTIPPLPISVEAKGHFKAGFEAVIHLNAGEIDATLPFDLTVDTHYNKTCNTLLITSEALLNGATFKTIGPEGYFNLDFILQAGLNLKVETELDPTDLTDIELSLGPISERMEIFRFDSTDATATFPLPLPGVTGSLSWPHLMTNGTQAGTGTIASSGESNNFLELDVDLETLAISLFPLLAPLDPNPADPDNFELIDTHLKGGLNFLQAFNLVTSKLAGTITFENNETRAFVFGEDFSLFNADSYDVDGDGQIEFTLDFTPDAALHNKTDLGFNVGYTFDLFKNIPIIDETAWSSSGQASVASINVFDKTFDVAFNQQDYSFFA